MSTAPPIDNVLAKLDDPKSTGPSQWQTRCPAHDDRAPSLSVSEGDDRRVLLHCHAGCSGEDVLTALGLTAADLFEKRNGKANGKAREIVATYDYTDAEGKLLYQVVRFEPKDFRQRKPDGAGGWEWKLGKVEKVPYRLPQVLAAVDAGEKIVIVEGEKDVHALEERGVVATCNAGGAGKWKPSYSDHLRGANVAIIADADEPGRKHAAEVAESLQGIAAEVKVFEPAEGCKDVSDHLEAGHKLGDLVPLEGARDADEHEAGPPPDTAADAVLDEEDGGSRKTQAQIILEIAFEQGIECWSTPAGDPYTTIPIADHSEHHRMSSRAVRDWLSKIFYEEMEKPPSAQALADAVGVLRGRGLWQGKTHEVHVRHAAHNGNVYIDMGDALWRAIEITPPGWRIVHESPVRFRRPRGLLPLPEPARDGNLEALRAILNVDDTAWTLIAGFTIGAMAPTGPYPILNLQGEHGTAKSEAARRIRALLDPSVAPLRSSPRDERDLAIAASNGRVVALDNVSKIPDVLSDALCRLSTGGGFATRELYSDQEEVLLDYVRPAILTGITEIATRGDLIDRMIQVVLEPIPETERLTEAELEHLWQKIAPAALGGLLDATVVGLARIDEVRLDRLPRLADHARWVAAAEPALGWSPGRYLAALEEARDGAIQSALETSPLTTPITDLAKDGFTGTAAELLERLNGTVDESVTKRKSWPRSARALSGVLRRLAPDLRTIGVDVTWPPREGKARRRLVEVRTGPDFCGQPSAPSATSEDSAWQSRKPPRSEADGRRTQNDEADANDDGGRKADANERPDRPPSNGSVKPNMAAADGADAEKRDCSSNGGASAEDVAEAERLATEAGITLIAERPGSPR